MSTYEGLYEDDICFFESEPFVKFWTAKSCKPRDIAQLLYSTFCTNSKGNISELRQILSLLIPKNPPSSEDSIDGLCSRLKAATVSITQEIMREDQHKFWNKMGMNINDLEQVLFSMRECYRNKWTFYQSFIFIYEFIRRYKLWIPEDKIGTIVIFLIFNYFVYPKVKARASYESLETDRDILGNAGIDRKKLNTVLINFTEDVPKDKLKEFQKEGYNLDLIDMDGDRVISKEEFKRFEEFVNLKRKIHKVNTNFCEYIGCRGNLGLKRSEMPQIMRSSIKELESSGNTIAIQGMKSAGADLDFVPYKEMIKELKIKTDIVPIAAMDLIPTQKEIYTDKTVKMVDNYFKGLANDLLVVTIPVITENVNDKIRHYILDGHHRWSAAMLIDPEYEMTCDTLTLPKGMTVRDFIKKTVTMKGIFRVDLEGKLVE